MSIRNHLHQWLHPRDPLLEAWKDDPFVEVMVARERRIRWAANGLIAALLLRRWGCVPVLVLTIALSAIVSRARRSVYWDEALITFVAVFACVMITRQALCVLRGLFLRNARSNASLLVLLQTRGSNPVILDLWMSGVRGRDMVKAMHVMLCRRPMRKGLWIFGAFLVLPILGWEPLSRVGPAGIVTYVLLAAWFRLIHVHFRYGNFNPLGSVIDRYPGVPPSFVGPALEAGVPVVPGDSREIAPGASGLFVLIAVILPMIYGNVHWEPRPLGPPSLFAIQVGSLLLANLALMIYRLGPEEGFAERLDEAFSAVDSGFDQFVREEVIQDPDAGRCFSLDPDPSSFRQVSK